MWGVEAIGYRVRDMIAIVGGDTAVGVWGVGCLMVLVWGVGCGWCWSFSLRMRMVYGDLGVWDAVEISRCRTACSS